MADFPTSMNCDCINKMSTGVLAYFEAICRSIGEDNKKVAVATTTTQTTSGFKGCIQLYPATQSDLSDDEESEVSDSEIYAMLEQSLLEAYERNNDANANAKANADANANANANANAHDPAEESDDVQQENDCEMVDNSEQDDVMEIVNHENDDFVEILSPADDDSVVIIRHVQSVGGIDVFVVE